MRVVRTATQDCGAIVPGPQLRGAGSATRKAQNLRRLSGMSTEGEKRKPGPDAEHLKLPHEDWEEAVRDSFKAKPKGDEPDESDDQRSDSD